MKNQTKKALDAVLCANAWHPGRLGALVPALISEAESDPDETGVLDALTDLAPAVSQVDRQAPVVVFALRLAARVDRLDETVRALDVPSVSFSLAKASTALVAEDARYARVLTPLCAGRDGPGRHERVDALLAANPEAVGAIVEAAARAGMTEAECARAFGWQSWGSSSAPRHAALWRWLVRASREGTEETRFVAAERLAQWRADEPAEVATALGAALGDPSDAVARAAAEGCGARAAREGLEAVDALLRDPRPAARLAGVRALGHGGLAFGSQLARALRTTADEDEQTAAAARALVATLATPVALDGELCAAVASVRDALRAQPMGEAVEEKLAALADGAEGARALLDALPDEAPGLPFARLRRGLARVARGEDLRPCPVCSALERAYSTRALPAAAAALRPEIPPGDKPATAHGCPSCGATYLHAQSSHWDLVEEVFVELERLPYARALARLAGEARDELAAQRDPLCERWRDRLDHPRAWSRRDAAWNLCELDLAEGRWSAHEMLLAHEDPSARHEALLSLSRLAKLEAPTPALLGALDAIERGPDPRARDLARPHVVAAQLGALDVTAAVGEALAEGDPDRQAALVLALAKPEAHAHARWLLTPLRSPHRRVRDAAAKFLAQAAEAGALDADLRSSLCAVAREADAGLLDGGVADAVFDVFASVPARHDELVPLAARALAEGHGYHALRALLAQSKLGAPLGERALYVGDAANDPALYETAAQLLRAELARSGDSVLAARALARALPGPSRASVVAELTRVAASDAADLRAIDGALRAALRGSSAYERDALVRLLVRNAARRGADEVRPWVGHANPAVVAVAANEAAALGLDPRPFEPELDAARALCEPELTRELDAWAAAFARTRG